MRFTTGMTVWSAAPPRCSKAARIFSAFDAPRPLVRINLIVSSGLEHNLVQRVFDNAGGAGGLEAWNHFTRSTLLDNRIHSYPVRIAEVRNGRRIQRRQHSEN